MRVSLFALLLALVVSLSSSLVQAAGLDVTGVVLDTAPIFTVATLIFVALGSMWAIRKVIKTINKS